MRRPPAERQGSSWKLIAFWAGAAFVFYVTVMLLWLVVTFVSFGGGP